jgi:hypothetical protein
MLEFPEADEAFLGDTLMSATRDEPWLRPLVAGEGPSA